MAEVLAAFPEGVAATYGSLSKFLDGQIWQINVSETNFKSASTLRQYLTHRARARGLSGKARIVDGVLIFQAIPCRESLRGKGKDAA